MTTYKIDKDVPIPQTVIHGSRRSAYPLAVMAVGESFFVAVPPENLLLMRNRLANVRLAAKKKLGRTFTVRTVEGGLRIWRTG